MREACAFALEMLLPLLMIDRPTPWDLPQFDAYGEGVLQRMADNRDVMGDEHGEPYYTVYAAGIERNGNLRLDLEADCSGLGMPDNTPITMRMDLGSEPNRWSIKNTLMPRPTGKCRQGP